MSVTSFRAPRASNFKKTEFIELSPGNHIIRILTVPALMVDTHFVRMTTIKCLGDECPVCQNNLKLRTEHPGEKNPTVIPGYSSRRQLAYVNVLDRTPGKICPNCSAQVKRVGNAFPASCPKCGAIVSAVKAEPINKVKVLSKGKQFFDQVEFHQASILDEETQTPIGVQNYDLNVLVMGPKTPPAISALASNNDVVEVNPEDLFDLEKAIITLDENEVRDLLRGVNVTDIFRARREAKALPVVDNEETRNEISDLFAN